VKKGFLIVIEGIDGSGKSTQVKLLGKRLNEMGLGVKQIEFPTYTKSSSLLEMYLNGDFGKNPEDVSPYVSSVFFAVDRYASFNTDWKRDYNEGKVILTGRYTTSNAIHQGSKMNGADRDKFLEWLEDFEYGIMGIPRPDVVLFLDMPPDYSAKLINNRYHDNDGKKDVHERDSDYLKKCYETAIEISERLNWKRINCIKNHMIRNVEDINDEIMREVKGIINKNDRI